MEKVDVEASLHLTDVGLLTEKVDKSGVKHESTEFSVLIKKSKLENVS